MTYLICLALCFASGIGNYGDESLEELSSTGLVKLQRTTIAHELKVTGSLLAQGANIGSIDVIGEANLTDTIIEEGGTILGYVQAHRSFIKKPLILNAQKCVFTSSQIDAITVKASSGFKGKQVIELRQKTEVKGPIHFESGKGEVHLYPGAQLHGEVTGGKVIKKH